MAAAMLSNWSKVRPNFIRLVTGIILFVAVGNALRIPRSTGSDAGTVSLAAAACGNIDIQLFTQDASNRILFRQSIAGVWQGSPQVLPLTTNPKPKTPLAAVSWQDSGGDNIRLYYLDSSNRINEAVGTCSGASCSWSNGDSLLDGVLSTSGLAAAYLGDSQGLTGIRVYYLNSRSFVSELAWDVNSGWNSGKALAAQASASSSLAVSVESGTTNLQVYYISGDNSLSQISYTTQWSTGSVVQANLASDFKPALAAVAWVSPESKRLYYIDQSKAAEQWLYQNGAWLSQPTTSSALPPSDTAAGPIAAVAWATNVRLYYISGGNIAEGIMDSSGQWSLNGDSSTSGPPEASSRGPSLPTGAIAGIAVAGTVLLIVAVILVLYFMNQRFRGYINTKFGKNIGDGQGTVPGQGQGQGEEKPDGW